MSVWRDAFIFEGFRGSLISFMLELRFNNNRAFMAARRDDYERDMRSPYYAFIGEMAPGLIGIDPLMETRPAKCLSRIYRDTRFTKDKSPYRDHHWVAFRRAGEPREGGLFFWFEIRIEGAGWGLGIWGENRDMLDRFRRAMLARPDSLLRHLPALHESHIALGGALHARMPIPEELPPQLKPWYPRRELYLERTGADRDLVFSGDIAETVLRDYRTLAPIYRLLRGESGETADGGAA